MFNDIYSAVALVEAAVSHSSVFIIAAVNLLTLHTGWLFCRYVL